MAQTRDLTYLGSPFGEGKGEAYILPKGDTPAYFLEYLKRGQDEAKAQKAALETQKAAQQKTLEFLIMGILFILEIKFMRSKLEF